MGWPHWKAPCSSSSTHSSGGTVLQDLTWNRSTSHKTGEVVTWTEVSGLYFRHHCEPRNPDLANKRSRLARFARCFANRLVTEISPLDFDEYAAMRRIQGVSNATINRDCHLTQVIADIVADAPLEELAKLPKDGANQVDHYVYGLPKRNQ